MTSPMQRQAPSGPIIGGVPAIEGISLTPNVNTPIARQNGTTWISGNGGAATFTLPLDSEDDLPLGYKGKVVRGGTATVTFAGGGTLLSLGNLVATDAVGSVVNFEKVGANTWSLSGDLA